MSLKTLNWKITFFSSIFLFLFLINPSAYALVAVEPSSLQMSYWSSSLYRFNITISGVNDVYGFQFDLIYNANVFNSSKVDNESITEGTFLNQSGQNRTFCMDYEYSTPGEVNYISCSRIGLENINGSGVLVNGTFVLRDDIASFPATSIINLTKVKMSGMQNQQPLVIDNTRQNGQVTVYQCLQSDPARSCTVGGCAGTMTCGSNNQWGACVPTGGTQPEICNGVDDDCDGHTDNGPGSYVNYTLNQSCSVGHQGICAVGIEICSQTYLDYSGCPDPDSEICDNGLDESCDGQDPLCNGDVTGYNDGPDRCVDILDLVIVGGNFGLTSGFDPRADIIADNEIDIFDLVVIGSQYEFGHCCGRSDIAVCINE